jgi:DNA (cytosine-5)-methyltransferase 1
MFRIIRERKPTWVLIENVPALRINGAQRILADLDSIGYTSIDPIVVGAWTVGTFHRRERVFILSYSNCSHAARKGVVRSFQTTALRTLEEISKERREKYIGFNELVPRNGGCGPDTYARIMREVHEIPNWLDRLRCLGNSVVPDIPELLGRFIRAVEEG